MSNTAQNWLDTKYSDKKSSGKIELYNRTTRDSEELTGELVIEGYVNIEEISFTRWGQKGKISKVTIANCPQVKKVKLDNNEVAEIVFKDNLPNLEWLDLPDNKLKEIDISQIPNLKRLHLARNLNLTKVRGLENATKLEEINLIETPGLNGQEFKQWKERPTKEDLAKAVKEEKNKYEGYIDPKDKTKLAEEAQKQGMVPKEEYEKVKRERDNRPDTTLADYQKLKDNQEKHTEKDLEHHKPEDLKPADYDAVKNELAQTKNKLNEWEKVFGKDKSPAEAKKEGTGATLTSQQQQKLNDYEKLERQKKWLLEYLEDDKSRRQYAEIIQEFNKIT